MLGALGGGYRAFSAWLFYVFESRGDARTARFTPGYLVLRLQRWELGVWNWRRESRLYPPTGMSTLRSVCGLVCFFAVKQVWVPAGRAMLGAPRGRFKNASFDALEA